MNKERKSKMQKTRNTKQKKIVLEYLEKHQNEHITIEEIQDKIQEKVGTTTIYRIINKLVEEGTVSKIPLNTQGFCYQYNKEKGECHNHKHYHLICEKCGKLLHFESKEIEITQKEALQKEHFTIDLDKVTFYGKCNECSKKEEAQYEN